jgi:soluble lytic murein transglycosylase-like protein
MNLGRHSLAAVVVALLAPTVAPASQVVLFEDGRTMHVERAELREGLAVLRLEGGGEIAVPAARVANWADLERQAVENRTAGRKAAGERALQLPWRLEAGEFANLIDEAASRHSVDPALLTAMAQVESAFNPRAVSHKGAKGILQLMPETAKRFGVRDLFDASQNIDGGAKYLSWLLERYDGRTDLALAGYNAGEAAVDQYGGIPPYSETQNYVTRVMENARVLNGEI